MKYAITATLLLLSASCKPPTESVEAVHPAVTPVNPKISPEAVTDKLIGAIKAKRFKSAYESTTTAYQKGVSLDTFTHAVKSNAYFGSYETVECSSTASFRMISGAQVAEANCILKAGAGNSQIAIFYAIETGEWRVTGITLGGTPAFPGWNPPTKTPSNSE